MNSRHPAAFLVLLLIVLSPRSALSGPNANAKILVHLSAYQGPKVRPDHVGPKSASTTPYCSNAHSNVACSGVITNGLLYPPKLYPYAYLLVTDGDAAEGIAEARFSVTYDPVAGQGVDVFGWLVCGVEFSTPGVNGPWPASGSTNRIVWDPSTDCQRLEPGGAGTGAIAVIGSFYLGAYTPATLAVAASPIDGLAWIATCAGVVDTIDGGGHSTPGSRLGVARFSLPGDEQGYNPCGLATPVAAATWSAVKSQLR